jgi:hypothetical protein
MFCTVAVRTRYMENHLLCDEQLPTYLPSMMYPSCDGIHASRKRDLYDNQGQPAELGKIGGHTAGKSTPKQDFIRRARVACLSPTQCHV